MIGQNVRENEEEEKKESEFLLLTMLCMGMLFKSYLNL